MDNTSDLNEKITIDTEMPPVDDPTPHENDVYVKTDDIKVSGDAAYIKKGHGAVLIQEDGPKDKALESHDYYKQGYTEGKANDMGKEKASNYEKDRDVDMMGRQAAPEYVQTKTEAPTIGPRKQKALDAEKKASKKVVESVGSKKFPQRLATADGT